MPILKHDPGAFRPADYGTWRGLAPWEGIADAPFGSMWARIEPGKEARGHRHHELEAFFIARGRGTVWIDGERHPVGSGDVLFVPPFASHAIRNDGEEELLLLAIYWEDRSSLEALNRRPPDRGRALAGRRLRVRIVGEEPARAEAEGPGWAEEAAWVARVLERYLRLRGARVQGSRAVDPSAGARRAALVRLAEAGAAERRELRLPICPTCWSEPAQAVSEEPPGTADGASDPVEAVWPGLRGPCPSCGASTSAPGACPACHRPVALDALVEPRCAACGGEPERQAVTAWVFDLDSRIGELRRHFERSRLGAGSRAVLEGVSSHAQPGIVLRLDRRWLTLGLGALDGALTTAAGAAPVVLCRPEDLFHAAVLEPALTRVLDPDAALPEALVTVRQSTAGEGGKVERAGERTGGLVRALLWRRARAGGAAGSESTGRGLGRGAEEAAEAAVRRVRALVADWAGWLEDLGRRLRSERDGEVPVTGLWTGEQRRFFVSLSRTARHVSRAYQPDPFDPGEVVRLLEELVASCRRFSVEQEAWRDLPDREGERRTALALELAAARLLAVLVHPLAEEAAAALWRALGEAPEELEASWDETPRWVAPGRIVDETLGALFEEPREGAE